MAISREEALAEAQRRGLIPTQSEYSAQARPHLSREAALEEARKRGLIPEVTNESPQENPWMSAVHGANATFGRLSHGILQPLLESGYLGEDVVNASKRVAEEREARLKQSEQANYWPTFAGQLGAGAYSAIPAFLAGGLGVGAMAPGLGAVTSGALGGAGLGAAQYVNPEESRAMNALIEGGIGAALPAAGKGLKNLWKARSSEAVAKNILSEKSAIKSHYKKGYETLFKDAEESGISSIAKPKIKADVIYNNATKNESTALREFLEKPTLKAAHSAQSDLGKIIRRLEKTHETSSLTTPQLRALEAAKDAQARIRGSMFQSFQKKEPGLAKKYGELTQGYKEEVLPYTKNRLINEYSRGESTPQDFVKALNNQKLFKAKLAEYHPEVSLHRKLPYASLGGAGAALGTYHYGRTLLDMLTGNR